MSDTPNPHVQLGCGTLILIAIIVALFSNMGTKEELKEIRKQLDRIESKLDPSPTGN